MLNTSFMAKVTRVIDGDTFVTEDVIFDFGDFSIKIDTPKFRLMGIDTPEKKMKGYQEATAYSKQMLEGKEVRVEVVAKDVFGRFLAYTYVEGEEKSINTLLLENKLAVVYER